MGKTYCTDLRPYLFKLVQCSEIKMKVPRKKVGGAQCLFQLPGEVEHVKGNRISPNKALPLWARLRGGALAPVIHLQLSSTSSLEDPPTTLWSLGRSQVVIDTVTPWHQKDSRSQLQSSSNSPSAARLTGLAIRGQRERHSFTVSTCILFLNSHTIHIMTSAAFCGSASAVEKHF